MPQSLVLNLVIQSAIPQQYLQGQALQALFFSLVDTVDPSLGNVLRVDEHNYSYSLSALQIEDASKQRSLRAAEPADERDLNLPAQPAVRSNIRLLASKQKPAKTLIGGADLTHRLALAQGLQLQHNPMQAAEANLRCWWRISFLDDDLFDHLAILWGQLVGEPFPLGSGSVAISSIAADIPGSVWASSCSYRDIYAQASMSDRDIHLQFITPTVFANPGYFSPLPTAGAVFHALRKRWNHYSGLAFAPSLVNDIVPTHFNIKTEAIERLGSETSQLVAGCTGQISFRIAGDGDPLIIRRINILADFARYCGVGYHTQLGWGVVRRISSPTALTCQIRRR